MHHFIEMILILLILTNFLLLGSSRLGMCIHTIALQGILLGLLPVSLHLSALDPRILVISLGALILKGGVFPYLLFRALRQADVRREVEPFVGYSASLMTGVAALLLSLWIDGRLSISASAAVPFAVPVSFFTILTGLFLLMTRRKALTQVIGYLVLENGIYIFGTTVARQIPFSVELGVLLDVWVAVFAMGIATYHINHEFDHTDVDKLNRLKG